MTTIENRDGSQQWTIKDLLRELTGRTFRAPFTGLTVRVASFAAYIMFHRPMDWEL